MLRKVTIISYVLISLPFLAVLLIVGGLLIYFL